MRLILQYRILEILQCLWIGLSALLFLEELPTPLLLANWSLSLLFSISSAFWLNDYYDYEEDLSNPRKILSNNKTSLLKIAIATMILSLIISTFANYKLTIYIVCIHIASILYSIPSVRLKSRIYFPFILHFIMGGIFFRSVDSIAHFIDTNVSWGLTIFWAIILGVGSLGNELIDEDADRKAKLDTLAVRYPGMNFTLISILETVSLFIILGLSIHLKYYFSAILTVILGSVFVTQLRQLRTNSKAFRKFYRVIFVIIILIFSGERLLDTLSRDANLGSCYFSVCLN